MRRKSRSPKNCVSFHQIAILKRRRFQKLTSRQKNCVSFPQVKKSNANELWNQDKANHKILKASHPKQNTLLPAKSNHKNQKFTTRKSIKQQKVENRLRKKAPPPLKKNLVTPN